MALRLMLNQQGSMLLGNGLKIRNLITLCRRQDVALQMDYFSLICTNVFEGCACGVEPFVVLLEQIFVCASILCAHARLCVCRIFGVSSL